MADDFQRLIQDLSQRIPGTLGSAHPDWGPPAPNHRMQVRTDIQNTLTPLSDRDRQVLSNLKETPRLASWSISISHTQNLGAWVAVPRPWRIGLDIEVRARISPAILKRISTPHELDNAPEPALLWAAKESFFKALEEDQPQAIPQLTVDTWEEVQSGVFEFQCSRPQLSTGLIYVNSVYMVAACWIPLSVSN